MAEYFKISARTFIVFTSSGGRGVSFVGAVGLRVGVGVVRIAHFFRSSQKLASMSTRAQPITTQIKRPMIRMVSLMVYPTV